jgi:hypothetical protein
MLCFLRDDNNNNKKAKMLLQMQWWAWRADNVYVVVFATSRRWIGPCLGCGQGGLPKVDMGDPEPSSSPMWMRRAFLKPLIEAFRIDERKRRRR